MTCRPLADLVKLNRSYRRFDETFEINKQLLLYLVDLARLTPSAANQQPLRYFLSWDLKTNNNIFHHLGWAGYLKNWAGPKEGERPTSYIVICCHKNSVPDCDHGIAAQTILLGAVEKGLGGCIIASIKKQKLKITLGLPEEFEILLVIALGKPVEKVVIEPVKENDDIKYWRDDQLTHHVPKRRLNEIVINY